MKCKNGSCGKAGRVYSYALGTRRTILCDECHAALSAIGMHFRVVEEVRDDRPVWLRRGFIARDESGMAA